MRKKHLLTVTPGEMFHNGEGYVCRWTAKLRTKCGRTFIHTGSGSRFQTQKEVIEIARQHGVV